MHTKHCYDNNILIWLEIFASSNAFTISILEKVRFITVLTSVRALHSTHDYIIPHLENAIHHNVPQHWFSYTIHTTYDCFRGEMFTQLRIRCGASPSPRVSVAVDRYKMHCIFSRKMCSIAALCQSVVVCCLTESHHSSISIANLIWNRTLEFFVWMKCITSSHSIDRQKCAHHLNHWFRAVIGHTELNKNWNNTLLSDFTIN